MKLYMEIKGLKTRQLHTRDNHTLDWLQNFPLPTWWMCGKIAGAIGLAVLAMLWIMGHTPHPAAVAMLLHIFTDFTLQSGETAEQKKKRGRHLLCHALVAGGLPMAVTGLMTGKPVVVLLWTTIGAASHYAIDWTRRFGMEQEAVGVVLDQVCHLAVVLSLVLLTLPQ